GRPRPGQLRLERATGPAGQVDSRAGPRTRPWLRARGRAPRRPGRAGPVLSAVAAQSSGSAAVPRNTLRPVTDDLATRVNDVARRARAAAAELAVLTRAAKDAALNAMADA